MRGMKKSKAIELLGGSKSAAAAAIGISYQAVDKWPEDLTERIADRVYAVIARRAFPDIERAAVTATAQDAQQGA
jgi:hypothetical protein